MWWNQKFRNKNTTVTQEHNATLGLASNLCQIEEYNELVIPLNVHELKNIETDQYMPKNRKYDRLDC